MRKRSRRRSRRRSSRRNSRNNGLSRRIGILLILTLLGVGGWLIIGGDGESQEAGILQAKQVTEENSEEAKVERSENARALIADANKVLRSTEGKSGADRRAAEAEAYSKLSALLAGSMPVEARQKISKRFNELSERIFFSPERNDFSSVYIVKSGDSLAKIAKAHNTTQRLLCLWNDIKWEDRAKININQSLKIVEGTPRIVVDKSDYSLSYYFGDRLAGQFIIAHGRNNGTPTGEVVVINKVVDPDLGMNVAANHREMDERWIGLTNFGKRGGIGIHGTKHQDSIPGESSQGCIRMFNDDVVKLYDWTPTGTQVKFKA